jgi:hypothetical protein
MWRKLMRINKGFIATLLLWLSLSAAAQTSNVTATLTDADSQTWNNGVWSAALVSPKGPPTRSGVAVSPLTARGTLSSSGVLTATLADTSTFDQAGATWRFQMCPNASAPCSFVSTAVTGASPNLSATLSAGLAAPRFFAGPNSFGYLDVEVLQPISFGASYFNVTSAAVRQFGIDGTWRGSSAGGAGSFTTLAVSGLTSLFPSASNNIVLTAGGREALFVASGGAFAWGGGSVQNMFINGLSIGGNNAPPTNGAGFGTANQVTISGAGAITATPIKSTTGTRYLCIDSAGAISSSASACSGT